MQSNPKTALLAEYDEILAGNKKTFSNEFINTPAPNHEAAAVLQYAFKDTLRWDAASCQNRITEDLLKKLHLWRMVSRVEFPPELNKREDLFFLATLIYPDQVKYDKRDYVIRVYQKVLSGEMAKFPRGFFREEEGLKSLKTCFIYAIENCMDRKSKKGLFLFFAGRAESIRFLKDVRLYNHIAKRYLYPIDFVHEAIQPTEESEFWYNYGRFVVEWNRLYPGIKKLKQEQEKANQKD